MRLGEFGGKEEEQEWAEFRIYGSGEKGSQVAGPKVSKFLFAKAAPLTSAESSRRSVEQLDESGRRIEESRSCEKTRLATIRSARESEACLKGQLRRAMRDKFTTGRLQGNRRQTQRS